MDVIRRRGDEEVRLSTATKPEPEIQEKQFMQQGPQIDWSNLAQQYSTQGGTPVQVPSTLAQVFSPWWGNRRTVSRITGLNDTSIGDTMAKGKYALIHKNIIDLKHDEPRVGDIVCTNSDGNSISRDIVYVGVVSRVNNEHFIMTLTDKPQDVQGRVAQLARDYFAPEIVNMGEMQGVESWQVARTSNGWVMILREGTLITNTYKAGQSIDDYITEILKTETDKERIMALQTYQRCVLPKRVKNLIEEALVMVLRSNIFDEWGFNEVFEKGLTNSVLVWGPPGTGKTMVCSTIAAVLGKNLLILDSGVLQSQIPGQVERNITDNFKKATDEDAVIMFDECDSVLYNRDCVGAIMSAEINHLLKEIENFKGVCLFTTNRLGVLDPAMQRRIIAKIEIPLPEKKERAQIWQNLLPPKMPIDGDIDFTVLSEYELAGGDIKNAIILADAVST